MTGHRPAQVSDDLFTAHPRPHLGPDIGEDSRSRRGDTRSGRLPERVHDIEGNEVTGSPFPVVDVMQAWEVWPVLSLTAPGIELTGT